MVASQLRHTARLVTQEGLPRDTGINYKDLEKLDARLAFVRGMYSP